MTGRFTPTAAILDVPVMHIEVSLPTTDVDVDEIVAQLDPWIGDLVDDLGLGVPFRMTVNESGDRTVSINGAPCRRLLGDRPTSATEIAWDVIACLAFDASRFLHVPDDVERSALGGLVNRGFDLRCVKRANGERITDEIAESCSERASVRFYVHPDSVEQAGTIVNREFRDELLSNLLNTRGIPVPTMPDPVAESDVPPGSVRLVVNDLRMPPVLLENAHEFLPIALDRVAHTLVTRHSVNFSITRLEPMFPDLVRAVRDCIDPTVLVQAVRRLAAERVPLGRLQYLLDAALESRGPTPADDTNNIVLYPRASRLFAIGGTGSTVRPADVLVENIRVAFARRISLEAMSSEGLIRAYTLDPEFERELAASQLGSTNPMKVASFVRAIVDVVGTAPNGGVILTSGGARRHVSWMLEPTLPDVKVVAYSELVATARIDVIARIDFL